MSNLIKIENKEGQPVVTSRQISVDFEKMHKHILETIRNLVDENSATKNMFIESEYENRGKKYPEYLITRDGFSILVMGFTGAKALEWKLKYIEAFNKMEETLRRQVQKPMTAMEILELQFKVTKEIESRVIRVEEFVDEAELSMADSKRLTKNANWIVVRALGGKKSNAYQELSKKVFADLYKQLHREFGVTSISEIKKKDVEVAREIINSYKPPRVLVEEINKLNNQMKFKECI